MRITIEKTASGGMGLGRHQGKVVFVPQALPGEEVSVRAVRQKKDYSVAEITEIHIPSQDRITPPCMYYGICGGCDFQHASYQAQLEMKQQILLDALRRTAGISLDSVSVTPSPPWRTRRRVSFKAASEGNLGFYRRGTRETVPLERCLVLAEPLEEFMLSPPRGFDCRRPVCSADTGVIWGDRIGRLTLENSFGERRSFQLEGNVFFQSNTAALRPLLDLISSQEGELAVDLYSGIGTFAAFLEQRFHRVAAVESDRRCLAHARMNLRESTSFYAAKTESPMRRFPEGHIDLLVTDPPRTGISPGAMKQILSWRPERIISVSCSPVTFARDVGVLLRKGYALKQIMGADLYPQTSHLECAAVLELSEEARSLS